MTTLGNTPAPTSGAISADLLDLAVRLATQHPLPAELAEDVAPVTAMLLRNRAAGATATRATL